MEKHPQGAKETNQDRAAPRTHRTGASRASGRLGAAWDQGEGHRNYGVMAQLYRISF